MMRRSVAELQEPAFLRESQAKLWAPHRSTGRGALARLTLRHRRRSSRGNIRRRSGTFAPFAGFWTRGNPDPSPEGRQ